MDIEQPIYTTDMYRALCEAIALGAKEVYYGDKRVVYRSLDEMIRIKNLMATELGLNKNRPSVRYGSFTKGIR